MINNLATALNIPFKGHRDYLHGTDILTALLSIVGNISELTINFHKMAHRPLQAQLTDLNLIASLREANQIFALMAFKDDAGTNKLLAVIEDSRAAVTIARIPYDEDEIIRGSQLSGNNITQKSSSGGNLIERIVALNKALLNQFQGQQEWLFSRLDLAHIPSVSQSLSLEILRSVGPDHYRSVIHIEGKKIGFIYFTRRPS
jgi:hypothetical protein